jgi:hypothetical protein
VSGDPPDWTGIWTRAPGGGLKFDPAQRRYARLQHTAIVFLDGSDPCDEG